MVWSDVPDWRRESGVGGLCIETPEVENIEMDAPEMMAVCGLDCGTCDIRRVPADPEAAQRVVEWFHQREWLEEDEGVAEILERGMYCQGCRGDRSLHWSPDCQLLICCIDEKHLEHCAQCADFVCQKLDAFSNDGQAHHKVAVERLKQIAKKLK
jgi:hypothetical protein